MPPERPRRAHQLVGALHHGDAVGNEVLALRECLRAAGFESEVFAGEADARLDAERHPPEVLLDGASADDALVHHFSPGSPVGQAALRWPGRLALVYHNVTPARFFAGWSAEAARLALGAAEELRGLVPRTTIALAKSAFSRRDLDAAGFERTGLMPYLHDPARRHPASGVALRLYADGRTNVLCVGRLAPIKRLEDVLRVFAALQRAVPRSRLLLAGDRGVERYVHALERVVRERRLRDVVFCGKVEEDELRALYSVAHVYLSLSEHEGYGVPLVDAVLCGVPVVARDAGAVAETLDGAGLLLSPDASPVAVAGLVERVARDPALRRRVLEGQERLAERVRATDHRARAIESLAAVLEPSR